MAYIENSQNNEESEKSSQKLHCLKTSDLFNFYIGTNAGGKLKTSIEKAKKSIRIASPYVSKAEIEMLREKYLGKMDNITIITAAEEDLANKAHVEGLKSLIHREKQKDSARCEYNAIFKSVIFRGSFFHAKFYIIDDEIVYAGSMNFTGKGLEKSIETCITFKDSDTVQKLIVYFEQLFNANLYKWDISVLGKKVYEKLKSNGGKS